MFVCSWTEYRVIRPHKFSANARYLHLFYPLAQSSRKHLPCAFNFRDYGTFPPHLGSVKLADWQQRCYQICWISTVCVNLTTFIGFVASLKSNQLFSTCLDLSTCLHWQHKSTINWATHKINNASNFPWFTLSFPWVHDQEPQHAVAAIIRLHILNTERL